MMTCFSQADSVWQILLLVISLFAVISLAGGIVLLFNRKCRLSKQIVTSAVLLLNIALFVLMQLDSRITGAQQGLHLHIPYVVLMFISLMSPVYGVWAVLSETQNRKTINHSSIKEAFDNLPTGVCFFNGAGLPVLCNPAMHRFGFAVCGKDIQYISDLEGCFSDAFLPVPGVRKDGKVFILADDCAWHLEKRTVIHEDGNRYTQYIASDVTDLHRNRVQLQQENRQLRKVQADLKKLSANVVAVTREEEILNTKMRVHDEMGRCLMAAQQYLKEDHTDKIPDSFVASWHRAVSMIKYNIDSPEEDMLLQIRKTCHHVDLAFLQTGLLPREESAAYILTCAVRECVTNAVRYAQASELYAVFSENETSATVIVSNNGRAPEREITEGGGLSTLRRRVERSGGVMSVQSFPKFQLTVTVPKGKDGVL